MGEVEALEVCHQRDWIGDLLELAVGEIENFNGSKAGEQRGGGTV